KSPDEWRPIPGSLEAIARLTQADYRIIVASNQSGLSRGLLDIETLNQIHQKMYKQLSALGGHIEAIFFCPHSSRSGCSCRKPRPGMFQDIAARLSISLNDIPAVGDSLRDLQAAKAAGASPMLVLTGKGQKTQKALADSEVADAPIFNNLSDAADHILANPAI
ncbi:MAG: D-glycero-beta-D-manno-heptose 1,7-bisphosphate 7-phosphatase, partial [Pseudomonadota bacterium]